MSRRALAAAVLLLAALAIAVAAFRALRPEPSDEDRIRALVSDAVRAAAEKRVGDVVRDVSERFEGEGLDRRGVKQLVAAQVLRGTWISATLAGVTVAVEGDAARAAADVVLSRSGRGASVAELLPADAGVHRFLLRLEREEGGWKVVRARWRAASLEEAAAGPELPPGG